MTEKMQRRLKKAGKFSAKIGAVMAIIGGVAIYEEISKRKAVAAARAEASQTPEAAPTEGGSTLHKLGKFLEKNF